MPRREANLETVIQQFISQLQKLYGEELLSVTLFGSAAGVDYAPERSDLNFLVVLQHLDADRLQRAFRFLKEWRQRQLATPLLFEAGQLEPTARLFPLEFLEMQDQHETLYGPDPLAPLAVPPQHLKLQCEQELRAKGLRLYTAYLESQGQPAALEQLLIASVKSFGVIMRALLRLKQLPAPREFLEILSETERIFQIELEGFREAHQLRMGFRRLDAAEAEALFRHFAGNVKVLTRKAEAIFGGDAP
jgi:hypothetical protein